MYFGESFHNNFLISKSEHFDKRKSELVTNAILIYLAVKPFILLRHYCYVISENPALHRCNIDVTGVWRKISNLPKIITEPLLQFPVSFPAPTLTRGCG